MITKNQHSQLDAGLLVAENIYLLRTQMESIGLGVISIDTKST